MIAGVVDLNDENYKAVIEATDNISSSYEKKRVLSRLIKNNDFNKTKSLFTISSIKAISSNYEKSNLLILLGPKLPDDTEVKDAFRSAARSITSDHEYGKVMRAVDF